MRQQLIRMLCGMALGCATLTACADTPSRIVASYELTFKGFKVATVQESYVRNGTNYRIESISRAVGIARLIKPETIIYISEGTVSSQGLRPLSFSHSRELEKERNATAKFNWMHAALELHDRDGQRKVDLPGDTQDRLSAMYQFQFISLRDIHELDYNQTDGSKIDEYHYSVMPEQSIGVPFGICKAHYLVTKPQPDGWQSEVWLRTQDHVSCKAILTDVNGDRYIQLLTGLTVTP